MSDTDNENSTNPEQRSDMLQTGMFFASRFRIIKSLGQGAMGKVYLASDLMLGGGHVALKLLSSDLENDSKHLARFLREVQFTRKVTHPAVVRTYDIGKFENSHYFTMEYIEGQNLSEMLKSKPCSTEKCIDILKQLCEGLYAIHSSGIVHRDLKSSNVLITKHGKVKIADFGVARTDVSNLTIADELVGSATHIAPEIWKQSQVSQQSDLYSLGVILYELICGTLPFDGKTPYALMWSHLKSVPVNPKQRNPNTPAWLAELCQKLLSKEAVNRPNSAKKVLEIIKENNSVSKEKEQPANNALPAVINTPKKKASKLKIQIPKIDVWSLPEPEASLRPARGKRKHSGLKLKVIVDSLKRDQSPIKESIKIADYSPFSDKSDLQLGSIAVIKRILLSIISTCALVALIVVVNNNILHINNVSLLNSTLMEYGFNKLWIALSLAAILLSPFFMICSIINGLGYGLSCLIKLCIIAGSIYLLTFASKLFYITSATHSSLPSFQALQAKSSMDAAIVNLTEILSLQSVPTAFNAPANQGSNGSEFVVTNSPSRMQKSTHFIFISVLLVIACAIVCNFNDRTGSFFKSYYFLVPILVVWLGNLILIPEASNYEAGLQLTLGNTSVVIKSKAMIIGVLAWGSMLVCAVATLGWRIKLRS